MIFRLEGGNLWSGRENNRARAPVPVLRHGFVGTNRSGRGSLREAAGLAKAIAAHWLENVRDRGQNANQRRSLVVFTGGEPLLQIDERLVRRMHDEGSEVAVQARRAIVGCRAQRPAAGASRPRPPARLYAFGSPEAACALYAARIASLSAFGAAAVPSTERR